MTRRAAASGATARTWSEAGKAVPLRRWFGALRSDWRQELAALTPTALYSVRVGLSIGLALWFAAFVQLGQPLSAATTVLIVANPSPGALVSKSVWRIVGTLIGAVLGVGLMAIFPQQPLLFFAGLSLVIGIACFVATLLRFFRAYAAVLSGYTIIIIASGAFSNPDRIFMGALTRVSVVVIGIVSTAIVFRLTTPTGPDNLRERIDRLLREVLGQFVHLAPPPDAGGGASAQDGASRDFMFREMDMSAYGARARLLSQCNAMIETIEYASSGDYEIGRRARALQEGVARLLGMLSAHHASWRALATTDQHLVHQARAISAELMRALCAMPGKELLHAESAAVRGLLDDAMTQLDALACEARDLEGLAAIDSERDIVEQLRRVVLNLSDRVWRERRVRLAALLEWSAAIRNGFRGVLVTLLATLSWYVFRWDAGPNMLIYVIAASCLLATASSAAAAAVMLGSGTLLAIPGSYAFQALLLPRVDGFVMVWLSLFVCLLPGIWIQFHPRYALRGFGYAVFCSSMCQVQNPIRFNDLSLLNSWVAYAVGVIAVLLVFRVILPTNQRLEAGRLSAGLCRAVEDIAKQPLNRRLDWVGWEQTQMQRVLRIAQRLSLVETSVRVFHVTDAALTAVSIGRVVARLRRLMNAPEATGVQTQPVREALLAMRALRQDPLNVSLALRRQAQRLLVGTGQGAGNMGSARRMAACLLQIAQLVDVAPGFFHKNGPMQQAADHPRAHADLRLATSHYARAA
ncbi:FUSC family protein [Acetobacter nitrogenifigens]|uniref:Fusaric acid resistance protein n=1 Tax=Acetobacter nitrogenifigens DSM 23921 = NBRC 105050 TaxID=1120919 RepID=A0A511X9X5_9PROT|nr:FUSC family protein [Acetobacter nitrogenifigens]GEN59749.1 fusaric acid resistance protein [Acetobacter nitrogenifigens DSM 23921 = NBRC 105050]